MLDDYGSKKLIDLRGSGCPEPIIQVAKELMNASQGDSLIVLLDSEECLNYLRDLVSVSGVGELSLKKLSNYYRVEICVK